MEDEDEKDANITKPVVENITGFNKSIPNCCFNRELGKKLKSNKIPTEFQLAAEENLITRLHDEFKCQLPDIPKSTFLMVFSPDGKRVASTHGNHNVYVTDLTSGKNIKTLTGHPRTPWCIAFHPSSNQILATGCLGGQVRVWDLHGGSEIWNAESFSVIASLAFHPVDRMLVIASYNELHFWDWSQPEPFAKCYTGNEKEKVKYVAFDQLGHKLITGVTNAPARGPTMWDRVAAPAPQPPQPPPPQTTQSDPANRPPQSHNPPICYRYMVEQYEQLVQRFYDFSRARTMPTMDRGTDPMDHESESSRNNESNSRSSSSTANYPSYIHNVYPPRRIVRLPTINVYPHNARSSSDTNRLNNHNPPASNYGSPFSWYSRNFLGRPPRFTRVASDSSDGTLEPTQVPEVESTTSNNNSSSSIGRRASAMATAANRSGQLPATAPATPSAGTDERSASRSSSQFLSPDTNPRNNLLSFNPEDLYCGYFQHATNLGRADSATSNQPSGTNSEDSSQSSVESVRVRARVSVGYRNSETEGSTSNSENRSRQEPPATAAAANSTRPSLSRTVYYIPLFEADSTSVDDSERSINRISSTSETPTRRPLSGLPQETISLNIRRPDSLGGGDNASNNQSGQTTSSRFFRFRRRRLLHDNSSYLSDESTLSSSQHNSPDDNEATTNPDRRNNATARSEEQLTTRGDRELYFEPVGASQAGPTQGPLWTPWERVTSYYQERDSSRDTDAAPAPPTLPPPPPPPPPLPPPPPPLPPTIPPQPPAPPSVTDNSIRSAEAAPNQRPRQSRSPPSSSGEQRSFPWIDRDTASVLLRVRRRLQNATRARRELRLPNVLSAESEAAERQLLNRVNEILDRPLPERPRRGFSVSRRSAFQPRAGANFKNISQPNSSGGQQASASTRQSSSSPRQSSSSSRQPNSSSRQPELADVISVRYGIQILSRQIDDMQRLCRARLEVLQLQQVRRMWDDLQSRIYELHGNVRELNAGRAAGGGGSSSSNVEQPEAAAAAATADASRSRSSSSSSAALAAAGDQVPSSRRTAATSRAGDSGNEESDNDRGQDLITDDESDSEQPAAASSRPPPAAAAAASSHNRYHRFTNRVPRPLNRHRNIHLPGAGSRMNERNSFRFLLNINRRRFANGQQGVYRGDRGSESSRVESGDSSTGTSEREGGTPRGVKRKLFARGAAAGAGASTSSAQAQAAAGPSTSSEPVASNRTFDEMRTTMRCVETMRETIMQLESMVWRQRERNTLRNLRLSRFTRQREERMLRNLWDTESSHESGRDEQSEGDSAQRNETSEDTNAANDHTRRRARHILMVMVDSLTQLFEQDCVSRGQSNEALHNRIYYFYVLLQLALNLTELLLAKLVSSSQLRFVRQEIESLDRRSAGGSSRPAGQASSSQPAAAAGAGAASTEGSAATASGDPVTRSILRLRLRQNRMRCNARREACGQHPRCGSSSQHPTARDARRSSANPPSGGTTTTTTTTNSAVTGNAVPNRGTSTTTAGGGAEAGGEGGTSSGGGGGDGSSSGGGRSMPYRIRIRNAMLAHRLSVPVVRVNDLPAPDPVVNPPHRPRPPSPPLPFNPFSRFLNFPYNRSSNPLDDSSEDSSPQDQQQQQQQQNHRSGESFLLMRGYSQNAESVADTLLSMSITHRIQVWDFSTFNIPDISNTEKNLVVNECRIHNDASVDVSRDGHLLVTLLPSGRISMLGVYSLQWGTLGQLLYRTSFEQNAVSVSLSPTARHLVVGLGSRGVGYVNPERSRHSLAQIFRLEGAQHGGTSQGRLKLLRSLDPAFGGLVSLNCIRWAPNPGQGLVYGTNTGELKLLR